MTSKASSLTKFINEQKALLWRRMPLLALSSLMYFLYYVFGTVMVIQHVRALSDFDGADALPFSFRAAEAVSSLAGLRGAAWFIGFTGAVILGIQGFSYLFKSQTVDFYESRPEKRSTRFFNIFVNGIFIYLIPSLLGTLLSFLIAAASGCAGSALLCEMMITRLLDLLMFLAVYGMSTLASLLTGTIITAVLMNLYFFGIETLARLTVFGYRAAYFATADTDNEIAIMGRIKTLPVLNFLKGIADSGIYLSGGFDGTNSIISKVLPHCTGCITNIILAVLSIVLSFLVFNKRRSEDAGKAVIYSPLSVFIKYSAGILFSLDAGLFVYWIFDRQRSVSLPAVILTIAMTVFVVSIVLESIFGLNVRDAFKRAFDIPVIIVISIIVLFVYRTDALGYNRWLPDEAAVESAWLLNSNYNSEYNDENGNYITTREYVTENMFLTGTSGLLKLAETGQALITEETALSGSGDYTDNNYSWNATIGWRMKDGRTITRNILIPEDIDPSLMDDIIGCEEFTRGVYVLKDPDTILSGIYKRSPDVKLVLSSATDHGEMSGDGELLTRFLEIYKNDLKDHYNFSMASNNVPIGLVSFYTEIGPSGNYDGYYNASWPIYEPYSETIDFLKDNGLWQGGNFEASEIRKIEAVRYLYDDEMQENVDSRTYTDPGDIEKVFEATVSGSYRSAWVRNGSIERSDNSEWDIQVYPKENVSGYIDAESSWYRQLLKGKKLP